MPAVGSSILVHHLVLLQLGAELTEGHLEKLSRLGLDAACPIERALQVAALDRVQRRLEIEAVASAPGPAGV
jgi:hypothetical protein